MAGLWVARSNALLAFLHDILKQLKCALRVGSIEIAGRFVGQNDSRIVSQRARDSDPLLFASGKMTAGSS